MSDEIKFRFEVLNIKLQTSKIGVAKKQAYIKLIKELKDQKIHTAVAENKHVVIYSYTEKNTERTGVDYLYGKVGKGFNFGRESGTALNIDNSISEEVAFDTNKLFNPTSTGYIFIPEIHRFLIELGNGINSLDMLKFFQSALDQVKDEDDIVRVEIENEPSIIREVLNSRRLQKIDYVVTYTNDDTLGATAELFDHRLKNSNIGKIEVTAEADHNGFLNINGEELLEGGIELAARNGEIKSATILDENGRKKFISSKDKPFRLELRSTLELFRTLAVNLLMNQHRTNQ